MTGQPRRFPFRWMLPLAQLLLCIVILWPIRGALTVQIQQSVGAYWPPKVQIQKRAGRPLFLGNLKAIPAEEQRAENAYNERQWIPAMLNLPVGLAELPYVILNPAKQEWVPRGMYFQIWRAIMWPLVGMVFWWIAGRGIEALLAARRRITQPYVTWVETAIALFLFTFGALISAGVLLGKLSDSNSDSLFTLLLGLAGGLWTLLGCVTLAARLTQWQIRRQYKTAEGSGVSVS